MKLTTILALSGAALAAPGALTTSVVTTTVTSTVTSGSPSTAYTFVSGNPPSSSSTPAADNKKKRDATSTSTITEFTTVAGAATTTQTYYPCASPFPSLTPTLPFGDASLPSGLSTENSLYNIDDTTQGASAQACCNACFFELENCVQAYWYSYEGCVVSQATNATLASFASGEQESAVCPAGVINGLSYANDTDPAFQSTGNIAGPCGTSYANV